MGYFLECMLDKDEKINNLTTSESTYIIVNVPMGVAWVIDSVSMILHLILLEAEHVLVRPAPQEPPLAVEVGNLLASPDGATGHGGAITSYPPVG